MLSVSLLNLVSSLTSYSGRNPYTHHNRDTYLEFKLYFVCGFTIALNL